MPHEITHIRDNFSDLALLDRSASGDHSAFDALMRRYRPELDRFVRHFCGDPHDRDELLQEVMIKAWRSIVQFERRADVRTWLYRITSNAAIDAHRRRTRTPTPAEPLIDLLPAAESTSPERRVVAASTLGWALDRLPEAYRVVYVLAEQLGCPHAEVAALCGIPEATVRTRLWRARTGLRTAIAATA